MATGARLSCLVFGTGYEERIRAAIDSRDEHALAKIISSNRKMINKHIDDVRTFV